MGARTPRERTGDPQSCGPALEPFRPDCRGAGTGTNFERGTHRCNEQLEGGCRQQWIGGQNAGTLLFWITAAFRYSAIEGIDAPAMTRRGELSGWKFR